MTRAQSQIVSTIAIGPTTRNHSRAIDTTPLLQTCRSGVSNCREHETDHCYRTSLISEAPVKRSSASSRRLVPLPLRCAPTPKLPGSSQLKGLAGSACGSFPRSRDAYRNGLSEDCR
jgi:hypothetical protein